MNTIEFSTIIIYVQIITFIVYYKGNDYKPKQTEYYGCNFSIYIHNNILLQILLNIYDAYTVFFLYFSMNNTIVLLYYQLKSNEYQNKILSISNSYLTKVLFIDFNW